MSNSELQWAAMTYNNLQLATKMTDNDVCRVAPDCFPKRDINIVLWRDSGLIF